MVFAEIPSDLHVSMQSIMVLGQTDPGLLRISGQRIDVLGQVAPGVLRASSQHIDVLGAATGPLRVTSLAVEVLYVAPDILSKIPTTDLGASLAQTVGLAYGSLKRDTSNDLAMTVVARQPIFQIWVENSLSLSDLIYHHWYSVSAESDLSGSLSVETRGILDRFIVDHTLGLTDAANAVGPRYGDASSSISLGDEALPGGAYQSVDNELLSLDDAADYTLAKYGAGTSDLSVSLNDAAEADWYLAEIISPITLSQTAHTPAIIYAVAENTLAMTDEGKHNWIFAHATNDEFSWLMVAYTPRTYHPEAESTLHVLHSGRTNWYFPTAVSELDTANWVQGPHIVVPFNVSAMSLLFFDSWALQPLRTATATSSLDMTDIGYVGKYIDLLATTNLDMTQIGRSSIKSLAGSSDLYGPDVWYWDEELGDYLYGPAWTLDQAVAYTSIPTPVLAPQYVSFAHTATVAHVQTTGTPISAESTLAITSGVIYGPSEEAISQLNFSQSVTIDISEFAANTLSLSDASGRVILRANPILTENSLQLYSTLGYSILKDNTLNEFAPFVGTSTDPNAPVPPKWNQPTISETASGITFFFPAINPTTSIHLRGPELDNTDRLSFHRVNRESRGGTLILYADPIWPKIAHLGFQFNGLNEAESQEFLDFCLLTLGKEIGFIDWENREWRGVIVSPQEPIVRDKRYGLSASVEIDAEMADIYTVVVSHTLSTIHDVCTFDAVFDRYSQSNLFTITQTVEQIVDRLLFSTDTLAVTDGASFLAVFDRPAIQGLALTDAVIHDTGRPRFAENDIVASAQVVIIVSALRPAGSDSLITHAVEGYMVRPREGSDLIETTQLLDLTATLHKDTDSTLETTSTVAQDTVWPRASVSTLTVSDVLHTNYILSPDVSDTILLDHLAVQDSVFVRLLENTLYPDAETSRVAIFVRPLDNDLVSLDTSVEREMTFDRPTVSTLEVDDILHRNVVLNLLLLSTGLVSNTLGHQVDYIATFPRLLTHDLELTHSHHCNISVGKTLVSTLVVSQELAYTGDFNRAATTDMDMSSTSVYLAIFVRNPVTTLDMTATSSQTTVWSRATANTLESISVGDRLAILGKNLEHTLVLSSVPEQDVVWPRSASVTIGINHSLDRSIVVSKSEAGTLTILSTADQDTVWPRASVSTLSVFDVSGRIATLAKGPFNTLALDIVASQDAVWPRNSVTSLDMSQLPDVIIAVAKDLFNNVVLTDTATRLMVWLRYATTTLDVSSTATQNMIRPRAFSDTLSLTSAVDRIATLNKSLADTLTLTTLATQDSQWPRWVTHNLDLSQAGDRIATLSKTLDNSVELTDSLARVAIFDRQPDVTMSLTDVASETSILNRAGANTLELSSASESDTVFVTKDPYNDLSISELATRIATLQKQPANSIVATDTVAQDTVWPRGVADTLSLTMTATRIATLQKQPSNSMLLTQTATQNMTRPLSAVSEITVTDVPDRLIVVSKDLSGTLVIGSTATQDTVWPRSATSTLDMLVVGDRTTTLSKQLATSIDTTQAASFLGSYVRSTENTISLSTTGLYLAVFDRSVADTLSITDAASRVAIYIRTETHTIGVTDPLARTIMVSKALASSFTPSSTITRLIVFDRYAANTLSGLNDLTDRAVTLQQPATSTWLPSQLATQDTVWQRTVATTIDLGLEATYLAIFDRVMEDTLSSLADSASRDMVRPRSGENTLEITDGLSRLVAVSHVGISTLDPGSIAAQNVSRPLSVGSTETWTHSVDVIYSLQRQLDNELLPTATATFMAIRPRSSADTLVVNDTLFFNGVYGQSYSNSINLTDEFTGYLSRPRSSSDTIDPTQVATYLAIYDRYETTTIVVGDILAYTATLPRTSISSPSLTDTVDRIATLGKTLVSTIIAAQGIENPLVRPRSLTEPLTLTQAVGVGYILQRQHADTLDLSDVLVYPLVRPRASADTFDPTDVADRTIIVQKDESSTLELTSTIDTIWAYLRAASSSLDLSVASDREIEMGRAASTTIEASTTAVYLAVFDRSLASTTELTDMATQNAIRPLSVSVTLEPSDTADRIATLSKSLADSLDLDQTAVQDSEFAKQIIDAIGPTQVVDHTATLGKPLSHTLVLGSTAAETSIFDRALESTVIDSDAASFLGVWLRSAATTLEPAQATSQVAVRPRAMESSLALSDQMGRIAILGKWLAGTLTPSHTLGRVIDLVRGSGSTIVGGQQLSTNFVLNKDVSHTVADISQVFSGVMVRPRAGVDDLSLTWSLDTVFDLNKDPFSDMALTDTVAETSVLNRLSASAPEMVSTVDRNIVVSKGLSDTLSLESIPEQDTFWATRNLNHTIADLSQEVSVLPIRFGIANSYLFPSDALEVIPTTQWVGESDLSATLTQSAEADNTVKIHSGTSEFVVPISHAVEVLHIIERALSSTLSPSDTGDRTATLNHGIEHTLTLGLLPQPTYEEAYEAYIVLSQSASAEKVDAVRAEIYVLDSGADECISMDADGNSVNQVFEYSITSATYAVLDPVNDKIYWTEALEGKVMRADLDGTNIVAIASGLPTTGTSRLAGLTIDADNEKLYYVVYNTSTSQHKLYQNNLAGTAQADITPVGFLSLGLPAGISVDSTSSMLYINDWIGTDIYECTTAGGSLATFVNTPSPVAFSEFADEYGYLVWAEASSPYRLYYADVATGTPVLIKEMSAGEEILDLAYNPHDNFVYFISKAASNETTVRKIHLNGTGDTVIHDVDTTTLRSVAIDILPSGIRTRAIEDTLTLTQQIALTDSILNKDLLSTIGIADALDYNFVVTTGAETPIDLGQDLRLVSDMFATSLLSATLTHLVTEETESPRLGTSTLSPSDAADRIATVSHDASSTLELTDSTTELTSTVEAISTTIYLSTYADPAPTYARDLVSPIDLSDEIVRVHVGLAESTLTLLAQSIDLGYTLARLGTSTIDTSDSAVYTVNRVETAANTLTLSDATGTIGSSLTRAAESQLDLVSNVYFPEPVSAESNVLLLSDYAYYDIQVGVGPLWLGTQGGANGPSDGFYGMNLQGRMKYIFGSEASSELRIDTAGNRVYGLGSGPKTINSWAMDGSDVRGLVDLNDGSWPGEYSIASIQAFDINPATGRLYFVAQGSGDATMFSVRMSDGGDHILLVEDSYYDVFGYCLRYDQTSGLFYCYGHTESYSMPHNLLVGNGGQDWIKVEGMSVLDHFDAIALDNNNDYVYFGASTDNSIWRVNKTAPYNLYHRAIVYGEGGTEGILGLEYDNETDILYIAGYQSVYSLDTTNPLNAVQIIRNTSPAGDGTQSFFRSVALNDDVGSYLIRPRGAVSDMSLSQSADALYSLHARTPLSLSLSDSLDVNKTLGQDGVTTLVMSDMAVRAVTWETRDVVQGLTLSEVASMNHVAARSAENTLEPDDAAIKTFVTFPFSTVSLTHDLDRTAFTSQNPFSTLATTDTLAHDAVWPRSTDSTMNLSQGLQEVTVSSRTLTDSLSLSDLAQRTFTPSVSHSLALTHGVDMGHTEGDRFAIYMMDDQNNRCRVMTLDGEFIRDQFLSGVPATPGDATISLVDGKIFWAETHATAGAVKLANLDGSGVTTAATNFPVAHAVAVDDANNHIFVYVHDEDSADRGIWRVDYNGSNRQQIVAGAALTHVRGLEVNGNKLYIVDNGSGYIKRCDLTGSNLENIVQTSTDPAGPIAITIDQYNEKLYWSDMTERDIKSADLDGSNVTQVAFIATYALDMVYNREDGYIYYTPADVIGREIRRIHTTDVAPTSEILRIDHDSIYTGIALGHQDWITRPTTSATLELTHELAVVAVRLREDSHTLTLSDSLILEAVFNRTPISSIDLYDLGRGYTGLHRDGITAVSMSQQVDITLSIPISAATDLDITDSATQLATRDLSDSHLLDLEQYVLYDLDIHVEGDGRIYTGEQYWDESAPAGDRLRTKVTKFRADLTAPETAFLLSDLPYPVGTFPTSTDTNDLRIYDDQIYFGSWLHMLEMVSDLNGANFETLTNLQREGFSFYDTQTGYMYVIDNTATGLGVWPPSQRGFKVDVTGSDPQTYFSPHGWLSTITGHVASRKMWYSAVSSPGKLIEFDLDTQLETIQIGSLPDYLLYSQIWLHYDETTTNLYWSYTSEATGYTRAFWAPTTGVGAFVATEISIPAGSFGWLAYSSANDSIYMIATVDNPANDVIMGVHSVKVSAPHTHTQVAAGYGWAAPRGLAIATSTGYSRVRQLLGSLDPEQALVYSHVAPRAAADTFELTTSATQATTLARTLAGTLSLDDAASAVFVPRQDAADTLVLIDAAAQNSVRPRAASTTLTMSDAVGEGLVSLELATTNMALTTASTGEITVRQRWFESDLALTDTSNKFAYLGRSAVSALDLTDLGNRTTVVGLASSSLISVSDTSDKITDKPRSASNTFSLLSSNGDRTIVVSLAGQDSLSMSDVGDRNVVSQLDLAATLSLTDTGAEDSNFVEIIVHNLDLSFEFVAGFVLGPPADGTLSLTEATDNTVVRPRAATSANDLTHLLGLGYSLNKTALASTLSSTDEATPAMFRSRAASSTISLNSVGSVQPVFSQSLANTLELSYARDLNSTLSQLPESSMTLSSDTSHEHFINQTLSSTITLTDEAPVDVVRNAATTLILSDTPTFVGVWGRAAASIIEPTTTSDVLIVYRKSMYTSMTLSDLANQETIWGRSIPHTLSMTDTIGLGYSLQRPATSVLSLTDSVSANLVRSRQAATTVTLASSPEEVRISLHALSSTAAFGQALSLATSVYNRDATSTLVWQSRAWDSIVEDTLSNLTLDDLGSLSIIYNGDDFTTHLRVADNDLQLTQTPAINIASVESADNTVEPTQAATRSMVFARSASNGLTWLNRVWPQTKEADATNTLFATLEATAVIEPPESGSLYVIDKE